MRATATLECEFKNYSEENLFKLLLSTTERLNHISKEQHRWNMQEQACKAELEAIRAAIQAKGVE